MAKHKYELQENNSGGDWWLTEQDYKNLFAAGWKLPKDWDKPSYEGDEPWEPFCGGAPVPHGWRRSTYIRASSIGEAIRSFETATGRSFYERGCSCCGAPFAISRVGKTFEYRSGDDWGGDHSLFDD